MGTESKRGNGRNREAAGLKNNYIDDLIHSVTRVVEPNVPLLKDVLVIGGMPDKTQNLQYLSYNRDTTLCRGLSCEFSAVAVINNRRAAEWRLTGYSKKVSRWVFNTRWARNPLDLLLNNLTETDLHGSGLTNRRAQYICPVVAVPGIGANALHTIQAFESANQIKKSGIIGFEFYRKTGRQMAGT